MENGEPNPDRVPNKTGGFKSILEGFLNLFYQGRGAGSPPYRLPNSLLIEKPFRRAYGEALEEDIFTGLFSSAPTAVSDDLPGEALQEQDLAQIRSDAHAIAVAVERMPYVMEARDFARDLAEILGTCQTSQARNCDVDRLLDLISRN